MLTWRDRRFYIDDEPIEIFSGAIHYFRSMPEQWYDLLLKLKNCGLNTVETYCAWNLHEESPGQFDFTGRLDLERFIQIAAELGLYVILRPGPFICAEWDFGGLPAWLLKDESFHFRTDEGEYLNYVKRYFDELMPRILPHLETRGGNIILVAAENEYGSFAGSRKYMNKCADMLRDYGIDVPIITADGSSGMFLDGGQADGCLATLDFGYDKGVIEERRTEAFRERHPDAPILHVEHWIGNFSHWGEPMRGYDAEYVAQEVREHLKQHMSFNLYMFHGGTNFGFTSGANEFNRDPEHILKFSYHPDATSYDYDALLTEWGEITPKYLMVQKAMSEYLNKELPVADPIPLMSLGDIPLTESANLFDNLLNVGERHESSYLHHMEYYEQNSGYILYRTQVDATPRIWLLSMKGLADRAHIYFNGVYRGTKYRNDKEPYMEVDGWMDEGGTLDILVENLGHVNYGFSMDRGDRKGILENVIIFQQGGPGHILYNWETYTLPMKDFTNLIYEEKATQGPVFYRGTFEAKEQKACFVHPDNFTKGFVVVNGFNLGRYWEIGPQRSLYLPPSILKEQNEIIVFAENPTENPTISIRDYHVLDAQKVDDVPETIV